MIITSFVTHCANGRQDPLESDYYSQAFIPKKVKDFDFGLFQTKWFDYRHMSPLEATLAYVDAYGPVYRRIYSQQMDHEAAKHIHHVDGDQIRKGLVENCTKTKRSFTGYWKGRQVADALGMPYDDYISLAMNARMRHWKRKHLPRPEHLYHEWDVEKVQNSWIEMQSTRLYVSEHPAYMVENFVGTGPQNDYHEWLFAQAGLRQNRAFVLARFIREGRMPFDKVMGRVDAEEFEYVRYHLEQPE
jgi:hypothetical protein